MTADYNTPTSCNPLHVYAIRNPQRPRANGQDLWFTLLDPWNGGFYATSTPKLFKTIPAAKSFCQEHGIEGEIVKGFLDKSSGFYPGNFAG